MTWLGLKDIKSYEVNLEEDVAWFPSYVKFKMSKLIKPRIKLVTIRVKGKVKRYKKEGRGHNIGSLVKEGGYPWGPLYIMIVGDNAVLYT